MPPKSGGGKKSKAAKQVTNKRRRGFIDPDLRVSKRQERKDDAKFVKAKFGNFQGGDGRDERAETQVASTSSSEDEDLDDVLGRRPPRQRTHVFKNFAQRVAEVDVDVHRSTGALRVDPLQGSACFFHETLVKCAELNCGAHFSDFKREAEPLCQSLPMLVLHQDKVLASLLDRLVPEARHSLEALLRCLQALARDLRGDFAPSAFQRAAEALAALMRANEIAREPEILEHVFQALAFMCKWLQRPLAGDLVQAMRKTRALRRHPQAHVRVFAAQAVAFLLRVAPETNGNVVRGVRALLAEACGDSSRRTAKETEADLHGAGALIAESAKGAAHGMHSRASRVLRVALRLRRVEDASFFSENETYDEKHGERDGERDDDATDADARLSRASAVAEHAVATLCEHTRRGKCSKLWSLVIGAARRAARETLAEKRRADAADADAADAVSDSDSDSEKCSEEEAETSDASDAAYVSESARCLRAARAHDVVARAVETYRGARVEDYAPLFALLEKHTFPALRRAFVETRNVGETSVAALAAAARRLCLSLVDAHNVVAGASLGPESVRRAAPRWSAAVTHASASSAFAFLGALNDRSRGGSEAAKAALSALLPAAAPALVALVEGGDSETAGSGGGGAAAVDADAAATLLGDVCDALFSVRDSKASSSDTDAPLRRASPDAAAAIVARCRATRDVPTNGTRGGSRNKKKSSTKETVPETVPPARRRWALLRLVPHCDRGAEAWAATSEAAAWALSVLEGSGNAGTYARDDDDRETKACLAASLASRAALFVQTNQSDENAKETAKESRETVAYALRAVRAAVDCPGVCQAAADALGAIRSQNPEVASRELARFHDEEQTKASTTSSKKTDEAAREKTRKDASSSSFVFAPLYSNLAAVSVNLQAPSRHARVATLAFLCEVSAAVGECGSEWDRGLVRGGAAAGTTPNSLGAALRLWLDVNARDAADATRSGVMEYAKTSQVAIASITRFCESDAFEPEWAEPVALCALGATRLRLATLWPGLIKLLGAAAARATLEPAWAALFAGLEEAQRECLDAHDAATSAAKAGAPTAARGRRRGWVEVEAEAEEEESGDETRVADTVSEKPKPKETEPSAALALRARLLNACFPEEQGVDRWTRFGTLVRCVAGSPQAAVRHPLPLARLFLRFDAPRADGSRRSGKAWRNGLREWLRLMRDALGGGRSLKALERGIGVEIRASLERHVSADESDLAAAAIGCLGRWGLPHLSPENAARLQRVADEKTMKLELISLNLTDASASQSNGGTHSVVTAEHRPAFASLVVRCLLPRLKKRSGRHAPLRAAALAWIGRLDPIEIAPLVHAVVAPLEAGREPGSRRKNHEAHEETSDAHSWSALVQATGAGDARAKASWLAAARDARVRDLVRSGSRRPEGFIRAAHDLLKAAGEHVGAYLDALVAIAVELLAEASALCESAADARERRASGLKKTGTVTVATFAGDGNDVASREAKEVRASATRFLASVFERHPSFEYDPYWPSIASSIAPMLSRAAAESGAETAAPPAVALAAAAAGDDACARLLAADVVNPSNGSRVAASTFLSQVWHALGAPRASGATRACALAVAESLVERAETARLERPAPPAEAPFEKESDGVAATLLRAHAPALLEALRNALATRADAPAKSESIDDTKTDVDDTKTDVDDTKTDVDDTRTGLDGAAETGPPETDAGAQDPAGSKKEKRLAKPAKRRGAKLAAAGAAGRELELLKRLGPLLGRAAASAAVADVLVPVLAVRRLDESAAAEVLAAFAAVSPAPPSETRDSPSQSEMASMRSSAASHAASLTPLFGRLRTRHARRALCRAFRAAGAWDEPARVAATVLEKLHAESRGSVDGVDYDARLDAYDELTTEWFQTSPPAAAAPVAHHVLHELRGKDMALRHAAAAALERLLDAAVGSAKSDDAAGETAAAVTPATSITTLGDVVMRVVAPGVRGLLRAPDQATRAEAIGAFRKLAEAAPAAAPGAFAALADPADPEKDFFANAAHLQAHRRARALRLLSAVAVRTAEANADEAEDESRSKSSPRESNLCLPAGVVVGYLAPLATAALGDPGADVASTAAAAVGALAGALPWGPVPRLASRHAAQGVRGPRRSRRAWVRRRGLEGAAHPRGGDDSRTLRRVRRRRRNARGARNRRARRGDERRRAACASGNRRLLTSRHTPDPRAPRGRRGQRGQGRERSDPPQPPRRWRCSGSSPRATSSTTYTACWGRWPTACGLARRACATARAPRSPPRARGSAPRTSRPSCRCSRRD
jgi:U3 small nucleolar RNA-associated protein 20